MVKLTVAVSVFKGPVIEQVYVAESVSRAPSMINLEPLVDMCLGRVPVSVRSHLKDFGLSPRNGQSTICFVFESMSMDSVGFKLILIRAEKIEVRKVKII